VLPDGCVDVIVVGTMPRAFEVADGWAELIAVRFEPLAHLFGTASHAP
jgi:hypothetical protein